jgi:tRNA modification GTPase
MVRYIDFLSDTICSPITAPGYAGVSLIRISGSKALEISKKLLPLLPTKPKSHTSYLTSVNNLNEQKIDQALVTYFEEGKSFTGDESVEISCHGNPLIINEITNYLLSLGCRAAERGEFSFRAFYNGKIDLVQAESIQQIVFSKNKVGSQASLEQLTGSLSKEILLIEDKLINVLSHLEAMIDFVEEDIAPDEFALLINNLKDLSLSINELVESYSVGKNLNEGHRILLFGNTNAGKSSLFNHLLNDERAIVTDIHGTTRDLIRGQMFLGNNLIELIDSAGIRESEDIIEKIGIDKSLQEVNKADLVLHIIDSTKPININELEMTDKSKTLFVFNKIDLLKADVDCNEMIASQFFIDQVPVKISAILGRGIAELINEIKNRLIKDNVDDGKVVITQARHFNHLNNLLNHIVQSLSLLDINESPDLISQELSLGLSEIHQILGKEYNDEILDRVFSEFCIGK